MMDWPFCLGPETDTDDVEFLDEPLRHAAYGIRRQSTSKPVKRPLLWGVISTCEDESLVFLFTVDPFRNRRR